MTVPTEQRQGRLYERRKGKGLVLKVDCVLAATNAHSQYGGCDEIEDTYDKCEEVGQGGFSVVYRAVHRTSGDEVALKVVRTSDEEVKNIAREEFRLLKRIRHPNIVPVHDFFVTRHSTVLVMGFFAGDTLGIAVQGSKGKRLLEGTARKLFTDLLQALDHLHQHRIVHRDVKPENVLVSHDLTHVQLIDFNIARYLPEGGALSPNCTRAYAAPEVREGGSPPSEASDIWGAGLCLYMMLAGQCNVSKGKVDLSRCMASAACMFTLGQCLAPEPSMRPAAMTILQTPWVCYGTAAGEEPLQRAMSSSPKSHHRSIGRQCSRGSSGSSPGCHTPTTYYSECSMETLTPSCRQMSCEFDSDSESQRVLNEINIGSEGPE